MGTKVCISCKNKLDLSSFSFAETRTGRRKNTCKPCQATYIKKWSLLRQYNLTPEELQALVEKQEAKCAICGRESSLVVDHDHKTGSVRGLLCSPCNIAIGLFGDNISYLHNAVAYLNG